MCCPCAITVDLALGAKAWIEWFFGEPFTITETPAI
jgi:hypothetical protein